MSVTADSVKTRGVPMREMPLQAVASGIAVIRNERSANRLRKRLPPFGLHPIVVCDIMQMVQPSNARSKTATVPPLDEWILGRRQWLATTEEDAVVSGPEHCQ